MTLRYVKLDIAYPFFLLYNKRKAVPVRNETQSHDIFLTLALDGHTLAFLSLESEPLVTTR
jgi:hypothetical protein